MASGSDPEREKSILLPRCCCFPAGISTLSQGSIDPGSYLELKSPLALGSESWAKCISRASTASPGDASGLTSSALFFYCQLTSGESWQGKEGLIGPILYCQGCLCSCCWLGLHWDSVTWTSHPGR